LELRVAIGMLRAALVGLHVGLEAVPELVQQVRYKGSAGLLVAEVVELPGETTEALRCPTKRSLRISPCDRVDQPVEVCAKGLVLLVRSLSTTPSSPSTPLFDGWGSTVQFGHAGANGVG